MGISLFALIDHAAFAQPAADTPLATSSNNVLPLAVYGDSQAQGLAAALNPQVRSSGRFRLFNRTKPGTALGQVAAHDWVSAVQQSVSADHPAIAVMMFGGNDRLPARLPDGRSLPFRSEPWLEYYRDRLQRMLAVLHEAGTLIVWVGNPNTREQRYAGDMAFLNTLYREALPPSGAVFVDIWNIAADSNGGYLSHGPGTNGAVQRLRTDDGIHFTAAGYELVAQRVLRAVTDIAAQPAPPASVPPPPGTLAPTTSPPAGREPGTGAPGTATPGGAALEPATAAVTPAPAAAIPRDESPDR